MCGFYGPQSHYAESGLWMFLFKTLVSWISARSPHAARAAPPRTRRAAGTVLLQHRQRHHLRNRVVCDETYQLARRVRNGDGCGSISLSACSKVSRQLTMRTGDAVMASATRAYGPAFFTD